MTVPIIQHDAWEDNYDDPTHPIPSLTALDVHVIKTGGGSDLIIVIASPLRSDERSLRRLLHKIEIYLKFVKSDEYAKKCGPPTCEKTSVIVHIHPESDAEIFDLIKRCRPRVRDSQADLRVSVLGADGSTEGGDSAL